MQNFIIRVVSPLGKFTLKSPFIPSVHDFICIHDNENEVAGLHVCSVKHFYETNDTGELVLKEISIVAE